MSRGPVYGEDRQMIEIRKIDREHREDINIPNEPFSLFGKLLVSYSDGKWEWDTEFYEKANVTEMCFPDENYDYDSMPDCVFLGAYDGEKCVGLAIMQKAFFKYMYLYDLKVNKEYRRDGVGRMLIDSAKDLASELAYSGIYARGQDNNLGACLFYLSSGFCIGGLDTNVYRHTNQDGKADIFFYCEANIKEIG